MKSKKTKQTVTLCLEKIKNGMTSQLFNVENVGNVICSKIVGSYETEYLQKSAITKIISGKFGRQDDKTSDGNR